MNQTAVFLYAFLVLAPWCNVHLFIPISTCIHLSADIQILRSLHNHNAMKLMLIVLMILV